MVVCRTEHSGAACRLGTWRGTHCQRGAVCTHPMTMQSWFHNDTCSAYSTSCGGQPCLCAWHTHGYFDACSPHRAVVSTASTTHRREFSTMCIDQTGEEPGLFVRSGLSTGPEPVPRFVWKPSDATVAHTPSRDTQGIASALAGRRLLFMGDSMVRQLFIRLVCAMRQRAACIEAHYNSQLMHYSVHQASPNGPATDMFVHRARASVLSAHAPADPRDFDVVYERVETRDKVCEDVAGVVKRFRPDCLVAGLFYWKPVCRSASQHIQRVCSGCRADRSDLSLPCKTLAWNSEPVLASAAAELAAAAAEPSPRPLSKFVWLTAPPRPRDRLRKDPFAMPNRSFYRERNHAMRGWLSAVRAAVARRGASTDVALLDFAAMASHSERSRPEARQVLSRNPVDETHFGCYWRARPNGEMLPVDAQPYRSPKLLAPNRHKDRQVPDPACDGSFNYAVLMRLLQLIAAPGS